MYGPGKNVGCAGNVGCLFPFVQSCKSIVLDVDNFIDFQNLDASFGDRFVPFY